MRMEYPVRNVGSLRQIRIDDRPYAQMPDRNLKAQLCEAGPANCSICGECAYGREWVTREAGRKAEPATGSESKEARKKANLYAREYYKKRVSDPEHGEEFLATRRRYNLEYYYRNREKKQEYERQYYQANRGIILEKARKKREARRRAKSRTD